MKKINKILISLICLLSLFGCSQDGLNKFRKNGQVIELDYKTFDQMMINDKSFVFALTKDDCPGCKEFYPKVKEFLLENEDKKIYLLSRSDMEPIDEFTIASYFVETLGASFYEDKGVPTTTLYTPSICKIVDGEFVSINIGVKDKEQISYMYQDNYLSLNTYYGYNRKVQKKETFNLFISKTNDEQYDVLLREYFINNSNVKGNYLNLKDFDESENERLLNRINYYLGEGNEIESLPDYCLLQYEKGSLVNYVECKYDTSSLDALYNK